ncbi:hypothetical protein NC796_05785 [Aliifodinibius sp. S!AR15-10]|uniref:hypothetical protein n=1 Tax=Aliifodinibius sp. S!AR15-10 TaxID=2950437 RepID=UPI002862704E|nr:hypothetical protein [Aliifodinibius sp. S!AR15-10]MDR8390638.1 hypothetical protein [Aliifodinibius sp. S!AR15-10]
MGRTRKVSEIKSALTKKGFAEKKGGNHLKYKYRSKKLTEPLYTIISHGKDEYGINLLDKMAYQLNLTNGQLLEFIDCDISKRDYYELMQDRGVISR